MAENNDVCVDDTGVSRCWWCGKDPLYIQYHDEEWGHPVFCDNRLFEKICLEGFQAGLSWITILRKRDAFRAAFAQFDFRTVSKFDADVVEQLVSNAAIVRHRGKIQSTINNANRALELLSEFGSLAKYFWQFEPTSQQERTCRADIISTSSESIALSKDLKRRGWSFVGPTTCYAFMQAMGLVNDHLTVCAHWKTVDDLRLNNRR